MLSRRLGLPPRDATLSGTTIVILDPDLDGLEDEELGQHMVETLLWNFWPKLVTDHGAPTMRFSVEVDGVAFDIPSVEDCPPFHLFAQALRALRENSEEAEVLSCLRPKKTIGRIAFVRDMHLNRSGAVDRPSSQVPRHCRHVALMRPAELVVKYVEGHPLPDTAVEWAGVFKCDENPEVERAFAAAEPPAHDDWNPQYLPARSRERTYVNVGLKRIRQAIESFSAPAPPPMVSQQAESVAGVGDRLGGMLSTPGQGLGGNRGGGGGGGTPRKVRVGRPEFLELRRIQDKSVAVFAVPVKGPVGASVRLTGRAGVVIEGGKTIDVDPDGNQVAVLQWEAGDSFVASGESVEVGLTADTVLRAVVELTGPWAVRLRVTHEAI